MSTELLHRPTRRPGPAEPAGELVFELPPALPETDDGGSAGQALTMLPMLAGAGATALFVSGSGGSPVTYLASAMMGLSMIGMAVSSVGRGSGEKRRRIDGTRQDYQRYLEHVRRRVRSAAEQQRAARLWRHPDPASLWCVALGPRLWERRPGDDDFLAVRIGCGPQRLALDLVVPDGTPLEDFEPVSAAALRRFVGTHQSVPDLPLTLPLNAFGRLALRGPGSSVRALVRAMVAQLITYHPPDDVVVAVCAGPDTQAHWEWLKWAPHALSPTEVDAVGQVRLITQDLLTIETSLAGMLGGRAQFAVDGLGDRPHIVLIIDGGRLPAEAMLSSGLIQGVTVLDLSDADADADGDGGGVPQIGPGVAHLEVCADQVALTSEDGAGRTALGVPDQLSVVEADALARRMSAKRLSMSPGPDDALSVGHTLLDLLRIGDSREVDLPRTWRPRTPHDQLRVPIGVGADGRPVLLDLKESAHGGMGPHGLIIGATGSGKSELLRTLVLGLALTHSSETLNFVLVDFKGGATFASLGDLPHTSAVITNLEDELVLVDRMQDAITGELARRQGALRAAGNFASLRDYERAREQGADLEPMPSLLVVVDEFSELLAAKPAFIDLFVMIGRLGRSLGVHLLLASQRLEEGRLRGLDTQLSYRIGLRTFSAAESGVVLGVPDAHELPAAPGNGYLMEATAGLVRFKAAYVSGLHDVSRLRDVAPQSGSQRPQVLPYSIKPIAVSEPIFLHEPEAAAPQESMLDVLVARLANAGPPARQVWLPPLDVAPTLDELLAPLVKSGRGLQPLGHDASPGAASLRAPIGVVDRPFEQRRDPHWVELADSHFVVVGRPRSGKSTVLRSLIAGLALTHTPEQVQFYCLDFGGGTLAGLADLPHVGSVATRLEPDRLRRTIAELEAVLVRREELFTTHHIDSMASYRRLVAAGSAPQDGFGDVVLVVDGWETLRAAHEALETAVTSLAARGLGYGVHVALSAQRWTELRPALRDLISNRLELRLGDPAESEFDRSIARNVPGAAPGRGLSPNKLHFLSALPRIDSVASADDLADGVHSLVRSVREAWRGPDAPAVRMLPADLPYRELLPMSAGGASVPIGLEEHTLSQVVVDFDAEPHFVVIGDVESGKSNLLRTIARGITTRWTPADAKIITFDFRRTLRAAVPDGYQLGYVMNSLIAPEVVAEVVAALRARLGGLQADPSADDVPSWRGPRLFLLADDYDMVASSAGNPLTPLIEFLPQARDLGLHVVLARSAGGAGQGMYEPVLRTLRDLGTPGLLLSGSRDEGAVLGAQKMEPQPPGRGRLVHRRTGSVLVQTARAGAEPD